jgi:pantoate--beta-alanine ligase
MTAWSRAQSKKGKSIGFVPTMGYFHEGHLSLMRMAAQMADLAVVSLFVNPTQFGPNEDLSTYPADFERDQELAAKNGAAVLFAPEVAEMYPPDSKTTVSVSGLTDHLCGADRPGHFAGVTTVVCKLFHIVQPDLAVFGSKDYQQLVVIRRMCADLDMDIAILAHPIVREDDGLAMSSRNAYLDAPLRRSALCLSRAIASARKLAAEGERSVARLTEVCQQLINATPDTRIDYISFFDQDSLEPVSTADRRTRMALAVMIGSRVRLIDNGRLLV